MGPNFITKDITLTCYYLIVTFIQKIKNLKTQIQKGEMPLKKRECSNIMWTELGDTNHPGGDGSHSAIMFKYFTSEYGCFSAALKNKKNTLQDETRQSIQWTPQILFIESNE